MDVEFSIVDYQYLSTALLLLESVWEKTIPLDTSTLTVVQVEIKELVQDVSVLLDVRTFNEGLR